MRRLVLAGILALALLAPATASAFYGYGAQIVSADFARGEQGDGATTFAAIAADGRYVAIQTRARNFFADDDPDPPGSYRAGGVFRFDLETQALAKVADGDLFDEATNAFLRRGASNPSISADGRYVAFATAEPLVPADANDHVDVYVRDMDLAIGSPGAYELISARDGGEVPASYGTPSVPTPGSEPGSDVSRGVAISADGRRVAFRTEAPSDLPASGAVDVPADQVFVQQQRLCIARALAARPEVLLLDEPCSALDPRSTQVIEELILKLREEVAVVIVTHNMQQALRIADHVGFMYLGELVEYGPAEQVFGSPREQRTREYVAGAFG